MPTTFGPSFTTTCMICRRPVVTTELLGKVMCTFCTASEERRIKEAEEKPDWEGVVIESLTFSQKLISKECDSIKELLIQKNKEYGNSAIRPKRIFSTSDNVEQINVRIDDKLSRLMNSDLKVIQEDTELDLIGYLILRRVAKAYNTQQAGAKQ